MVDEPQMLRVYDASDQVDRVVHRGWPPLMDWIREHGADPSDVRRVEVLLLDCPLVRFHELDRDEDGHRYAVPASDGDGLVVAMRPPRDVLLIREPPVHETARRLGR